MIAYSKLDLLLKHFINYPVFPAADPTTPPQKKNLRFFKQCWLWTRLRNFFTYIPVYCSALSNTCVIFMSLESEFHYAGMLRYFTRYILSSLPHENYLRISMYIPGKLIY